jgi:nitrite reductase/ring-hydroxylating ferredoxin subunit
VRRGEQLHAWRDACPHFGDTPMAWRKDAYLNGDATRIVCHAHGARSTWRAACACSDRASASG